MCAIAAAVSVERVLGNWRWPYLVPVQAGLPAASTGLNAPI